MHRRALLATPALALLPLETRAQGAWPARPVRVFVGFPPGGSLDVMTRLACEVLSQRLGQPFVVETRSGASGNIGVEAIARAAPDGYTLGTVSMHNLLINPHLFRSLPFDPDRDFSWISAMWDLPNVAVVPAQHVPGRTLREFIAWARERPGGVAFGSSGVGTTIHLSGAFLAGRGGFQAQHVAYRGAAQTIPALLANDIQYAVDNLASYVGVIQQGSIRALGVALTERWPALPEVPTMAEAGVPGFEVSPWHLWAGPRGMPGAVVERLAAEIRAAFADPALQARAIQMGTRLTGTGPEALAARLAREKPIWGEMVRVSGAQPE
ncbi:MAG: tripartite tricarboxylate transporter substrate binding protein [Acetobacteraceae bacterium]|nr:tripartite tricarboxylate transporter substrate binding protein [Acetobacteraceae bacterium]